MSLREDLDGVSAGVDDFCREVQHVPRQDRLLEEHLLDVHQHSKSTISSRTAPLLQKVADSQYK